MHDFLAVIERGERNYSAYVPEIPGVAATGRTVEQTLRRLSEALAMHLEGEMAPSPKLRTREELKRFLEAQGERLEEDDRVEWVRPKSPDPVSLEIQRVMKAAGVTQAMLAQQMGTTQSAVARLVDPHYGRHSLDTLRRAAEALGYEVEVKLRRRRHSA
ncbi:type II toxin-antitoxin system HicB family antitoxin [Meiothermus granaticius]|uniref:Helix-turn-helix domain protein n=1 Tax=Meiothermus granaticius NBRC 107808 TaxID=1227551 RepID=A0A399FDX6_9DEIN|nr:type II toxin-antitoxin system HicB family antitoxin [Meiothermus granaticius]RIH94005.1 Helix-turn-helix domain protein [Meiothermus granaticius NBRC 107808]GEM88166.1 hypothetical protein MGR01S_27910 [Meiothermus granaticius NBRC 107808]